MKSTDGPASQRVSYEWLNLGHSSVSGQTEIFSFSFSLIKTNACLSNKIIILLFGNIFNVIVNKGPRVNDLQKKLWTLTRFEDIVSVLLIVIVLHCVAFIRSIISSKVSVPLIIYSFYFKDIMNFDFLSNVRKTDFKFSVINAKDLKHTLLSMSVVIGGS